MVFAVADHFTAVWQLWQKKRTSRRSETLPADQGIIVKRATSYKQSEKQVNAYDNLRILNQEVGEE